MIPSVCAQNVLIAWKIGWYINHSREPNIHKIGEDHIVTSRAIKAGEEILIDYNQLNEPEHLKEDYYKHDI